MLGDGLTHMSAVSSHHASRDQPFISTTDNFAPILRSSLNSLASSPSVIPCRTGIDGKYVPIADTIRGFKEIVEGKHDAIPEQDFFLAGGIEDVVERFRKRQAA